LPHVSSTASLNVVLGAGPVGRALADRLGGEGREVRVITRSGAARVADGVEVVAADLSDGDQAVRACAGAGVVYGCVGFDYTGWLQRWPPIMRGMLAGAEAAGARFIFMDNLYMYGPVDEPMREDMPLTDYGKKPALRAELTRMWRDPHRTGRLEAAAVRASDFYGPGVELSVLGEGSFGRLTMGKPAQVVGDPDLPHSFTYVPDIARALVTIADADSDAMGRAWHVPNAPDRTVREILTMFAERVGREPKLQVPPKPVLSLLGVFNANLRELKEMLYQWERPFQVDHSDFAGRFWDEPTPFEDGIAATAAWWIERTPR
jgi:nucleoside-diphosphate-sugar epimerase